MYWSVKHSRFTMGKTAAQYSFEYRMRQKELGIQKVREL